MDHCEITIDTPCASEVRNMSDRKNKKGGESINKGDSANRNDEAEGTSRKRIKTRDDAEGRGHATTIGLLGIHGNINILSFSNGDGDGDFDFLTLKIGGTRMPDGNIWIVVLVVVAIAIGGFALYKVCYF